MAGNAAFLTALLAGISLAAGGIYPADHFSYSTRLTANNFHETVKTTVDAGKTLFVRLIASEG